MNWYLVKLVYKIQQAVEQKSAEFDEQYRLIEADSAEEAMTKSKILGVKNELRSETEDGRLILWKFIDIAFVKQMGELTDGIELCSTTYFADDAVQYEKFIHHQAEKVYQESTPHSVMID